MDFLSTIILQSWHLLLDASIYILFGILVGGLLKVFLSPTYIAHHLGRGRFLPVLKAALFGVPMPLCSCGVLPAAAALKKQGANNGATVAFLVSTPESGVDSIGITYALMDPIMTVARPLAAFATAFLAGIAENLRQAPPPSLIPAGRSCTENGCCDGADCVPADHPPPTTGARMHAGLRYAFGELWGDIAPWFFAGVLLAGLITTLVPDDFISGYLGGGLAAMLLMLIFGIPLYICASASTPIAAALILKGVSPGAALVFLLVGPATNIASLSVLVGLIGKRATALYLAILASTSVIWGLALDAVYAGMGIEARALVGQASEFMPAWLELLSAVIVLLLSARPLSRALRRLFMKLRTGRSQGGCGCRDNCHG